MTSWRYNLTDHFGSSNGSRGLRVRRVGDITDPGQGTVIQPPGNDGTIDAPAIGATIYTADPYKAGTLTIIRATDSHVYVRGTDYAEVAPYQWSNLAIPVNTDIIVSYIIDVGVANAGITRDQADVIYQTRSEKDQPSGYVGLNSSGRIILTRLGSGTPTAGKYLDGSGAWTSLPSGGGSGGGRGVASYASLVKFGI